MKIHPFNLRQRFISHKYRTKQYESVIAMTKRGLVRNPSNLFLLELLARANTSLRNWTEGARLYKKVYEIDPEYLDCATQLARCAIYIKDWESIELVTEDSRNIMFQEEIVIALNKKISSLNPKELIEVTGHPSVIEILPDDCLLQWVNIPIEIRPKSYLSIDRICLDKLIGGRYLFFVLDLLSQRSKCEARNTLEYFCANHPIEHIAEWLSPGLEVIGSTRNSIMEWFLDLIDLSQLNLNTLKAICVTEALPPILEEIVRQFMNNCPPSKFEEAIRVIGRKSDPRKYISDEVLNRLILQGADLSNTDSELHTWMLEHILRIQNYSLLEEIFSNKPKGLLKLTLKCISNLANQKNDTRLVELLDLIVKTEFMMTNSSLRQVIAKLLVEIAEPEIAHAFALDCIALEPQDAVCGLWALKAAIEYGCSKMILETADIVLNMRSRSSNIDYASIAIAAIRHKKFEYAENILKENRLSMDLKGQRARIGLQFFEMENYSRALREVENTPTRFRHDHTIILYHALTLAKLKKYKQALEVIQNSITHPVEKRVAVHLVEKMQNNVSKSKIALNEAMDHVGAARLPKRWMDNHMHFEHLLFELESVEIPEEQTDLVTVIMTTHKWNKYLPVAVNSVLNQSYRNIELIIVDDCSPDEDVKKYDIEFKDSRIKRIRMEENLGTYACRNMGLENTQGKFVTFSDSDDWMHPQKIEYSINILKAQELDLVMNRFIRVSENGDIWFNGNKLTQFSLVGMMIRMTSLKKAQLRFDGRARFGADSEFLERAEIIFGRNRIKRTNFIEFIALHHKDSLTGGGPNSIDWTGPGDVRQRYANGYRKNLQKLELGLVSPNDKLFPPPSNENIIANPSHLHQRIRNILGAVPTNYDQKIHLAKKIQTDEHIYAFMATYPGGFEKVGSAVKTMLNQTQRITKLVLHVNGNIIPPGLPKDSRLEVITSSVDYADNGKFKHMANHTGYLLTVDDDICYPKDYVEKMLQHIEHYDRKALIGVHGAILPIGPPLTRWSFYREMRRTHVFGKQHSSYGYANVIGTGTMAFHSDLGIPNFEQMDTKRMVDLHVAKWAQCSQIPMVVCPRNEGWLSEFESNGEERIWQTANVNSELQREMISTLAKIDKWTILSNQVCKLENGPLQVHENWKSRELPPDMKLKPLKKWDRLPESPKVTIYVPAYNVQTYIEECIDSALAQTYSNFEISIHDDGSTDDTLKILKSRYGKIPHVHISTFKNQGISAATNQAILNGNGELILQLDSDDIIEPNTVEILVSEIKKGHVCVYGNFRRINPDGSVLDDGWEEPVFDRNRLMKDMIVHPPRLFRRDVWEFVGKHDTKLSNAEDFDLFLRMSEVGTFSHIRKTLYSYRILESSSSRAHSEKMTLNTYTVIGSSLKRQGLEEYEIVVPNPKFPRRVSFVRTCFVN